ncbi:IS3 family transposase, partial [Mobiluncus mulieris]|nr:IS3 family transposase [Mobiluncus mulieris]
MWITDFTYLRSGQGWVYLVAVRDAHTKRVIGYAMGVSQVT